MVWFDADVFFFKNPLEHIPHLPEMWFGNDDPTANGEYTDTSLSVCSCVMRILPSNFTITFLRHWIYEQENSHKQENDQVVLNERVLTHYARNEMPAVFKLWEHPLVMPEDVIRMLPAHLFPCGQIYEQFKETAIWAHANYRVGLADKVSFLTANHAWIAGAVSRPCVPHRNVSSLPLPAHHL